MATVPPAPEPSAHPWLHVARLGVGGLSPESRLGSLMPTPCPSGWSHRHLKLGVAGPDLSIARPIVPPPPGGGTCVFGLRPRHQPRSLPLPHSPGPPRSVSQARWLHLQDSSHFRLVLSASTANTPDE